MFPLKKLHTRDLGAIVQTLIPIFSPVPYCAESGMAAFALPLARPVRAKAAVVEHHNDHPHNSVCGKDNDDFSVRPFIVVRVVVVVVHS